MSIFIDHRPNPLKIVYKVMHCVCKIKYQKLFCNGFFMRVSDSSKFLISGSYFLNEPNCKSITIEILNGKIMNMALNGRFIKIFEPIIAIEIKETDDIYKDIDFLDYELNYQKGYEIYKNATIFTLEKESLASGKVIEINNDKDEFTHNIFTDKGTVGCPIILGEYNINIIKVIGVHIGDYKNKKFNYATFIGPIINEKNELLIKNANEPKTIDSNKNIINIDNNINNKILNNKIFNQNNPQVNNKINYNNKILPFNRNFNNIIEFK